MDFSLERLPKSQAVVRVKISAEEFEQYMKKAAAAISEEKEIAGFRRGKASYEAVKNAFGETHICEKAAELAARRTYPETLKLLTEEGKLNRENPPIGRPEIVVTKLAANNEFCYEASFSLMPEINLPDYRALAKEAAKEKKETIPSEKDVNETLEWLRESRAKLIAKAGPAEIGDAAEIDFEARVNGVKTGGGEEKKRFFILGKNGFIPGFEEKIAGMKAGEEKTFALAVPESWHDKKIAGKSLEFKVKINFVQERKLPELNDEFAGSLGKFSSLAELKKSAAEGIKFEKEEKEKQRIRAMLAERMAEKTRAEIPDILLTAELGKMMAELKSGTEEIGLEWEKYLSHMGKTEEELKKEWMFDAEKRVKAALCLKEIAKREGIKVGPEETEKAVNDFLLRYRSREEAEKSVDPEALKEYTEGVLRNEKVFEFLENIS